MLFQSYTACRPAELVDGTKSRGKKDLILDDSDDENLSIELSDGSEEAEEFDSETGDPVFSDAYASDSDDTSDTEYNDAENDNYKGANILGNNLPRSGVSRVEEDSKPIRKHKALCYEDIVL
ncbi:hypothetical protein ED733_000103 [Metarhizium rileyi]|uniref:Uncharacterized protein n=1 Tax=Metarhizium rileyi (strain RCEF 4871) TaxID=1649241 RepID=A0A5C6GAR3_METRR|nr:hypothetical protein ED733_000103 [Metarhizium rileyi]